MKQNPLDYVDMQVDYNKKPHRVEISLDGGKTWVEEIPEKVWRLTQDNHCQDVSGDLQGMTLTELIWLRKWAEGQIKQQNEVQDNETMIGLIDDEIRNRTIYKK